MGAGEAGPAGEDGKTGPTGPPGPMGPPGQTTWSALTDSEKTAAIALLKNQIPTSSITGPPGPQGPKGQDGTNGTPGTPGTPGNKGADGISDPTAIVNTFKADNDAMNNLASKLATNQTTSLGALITSELGKTSNEAATLRTQLAGTLSSNANLQTAIANLLTTDATYKGRIKGDPGSIGDTAALKTALDSKTLWCADGSICKMPPNYTGIYIKHNDVNHGIQYKPNAGDFKDGPFVHGFSGGQLGTKDGNTERVALSWHSNNAVNIPNLNISQGGSNNELIFNEWRIKADNSRIAFIHNNEEQFRIQADGDVIGRLAGPLVGDRPRYTFGGVNNNQCYDFGSTGRTDCDNGWAFGRFVRR